MHSAKQLSVSIPRIAPTSKPVVKLACGTVISVVDLPPTWRIHWTVRDKWIVANAVRFGVMSYSDALSRYLMHPEELESWLDAARREQMSDVKIKSLDVRRPKRDTGH